MIRPNTQSLTLGFDDALIRNVPPSTPRNHAARRRGVTKKRVHQQADLFGGAGGATLGSRMAYEELKMQCFITAINHNEDCVSTQNINHPDHLNLCTGVDKVNPRYVYQFEDLDALWASPVCTHFSSARGGTPINPQLRATVEQVVRWVRAKLPLVFFIENVPEIVGYGPVIQMKDKKGVPVFLRNEGSAKKTKWVKCKAPVPVCPKGIHHKKWLALMETLGYVPAFKADPRFKGVYFARLIRNLRREGYDVEWKVINCADLGAPTTRRRMFIYGVRRGTKYRIVWPNATHGKADENGIVPAGRLPWVPMRTAIDVNVHGESIFLRKRPLSKKTIQRIITGFFKYGLQQLFVPGKGTDIGRVHTTNRPMTALTTSARGEAVVDPEITPLKPFLTPGFGERPGQTPRTHDVDLPSPAICATGHNHFTQPFVVHYRGTSYAASFHAPAPALTAGGTHLGFVESFLVQANHGKTGDTTDAGIRVKPLTQPFPTVCGNRGEWAVCKPFVTQVSHGVGKDEKDPHNRRVKSVDDPSGALTTSNDWGVTHFVLSQQSGGVPRTLDQPAPAVATGGALQLIEAQIMHYASNPRTGYPILEINGETYLLDFKHRMLDWPELARIQSFPTSYVFAGNKTSKIKQIGNAVPPVVSRALVLAFWTQKAEIPPANMELLEHLKAA